MASQPPVQQIELTSKRFKRGMVIGGTITLVSLAGFIVASILKSPILGYITVAGFLFGLTWYGVARFRAWWHHG